MSNKDLELQQDCNAVIHELEKAISEIKAACIEPDIDTAEKAFNGTLSTLMENITRIMLHGTTWDDIKASIEASIKADMPF